MSPTFDQRKNTITQIGMGLNQLVLRKRLKEHGIVNVTFYGNDYLAESLEIGNAIWREENLDEELKITCRADSTNLSFVPDDTFDLVYTG